ncbi:putative MFS polyamine transporter [Aspergillus alliaceus]|uniref:putative MFS polyamine transporter n=1 Tax=Petromyces alliaceus TaxID=209559 RepID=UPI0012A6333B|nr:putative MFS polyamine transporter [Aspergillus alliaceus]KAB8227956.1 putative MFS polyamine transporter [Aspergillus alliaceus]
MPPTVSPSKAGSHIEERPPAPDTRRLSWEDPNEKRNPANWNISLKVFHTFIPCALAFWITFGTSVVVPATGLIAIEFNVGRTESILTLTLYTLGIALGPAFIAPLSETLGRKWVYVITALCLLAFTGGAAAAQNLSTLLICRFLAGFLGSAGVATGAGTIGDVWALGRTGGIVSLFFILGPFLGPSLGPLAGAYILHNRQGDWRWTQYLLLILGAPIFLGTLVMRETMKEQILRKSDRAVAVNERGSQTTTFTQIMRYSIVRPVQMLYNEAIVLSLTIYTAFAYAVTFSYFGSATYVLQLEYGLDLREAGLGFISVVIGYLMAIVTFIMFDRTLYAKAIQAANGNPAPEHRLYTGMVGSVLLPVGLFWNAWEAHRGGHWATLVAAGIPFGWGAFSLFLSTIIYMAQDYRAEAVASALAANGTLRYTLGAVFPLFTIQMYQNLGINWAGSVWAFISVLLLPIPWLLFKYGDRLRENSQFAQAKN